jgi:integrase
VPSSAPSPPGGKPPFRPRRPFTDQTAQALADDANLERLAEADPRDRGARDIWETIIATGRRAGEVLGLRLDCFGVHNGVPMLWHDQTKVDNFNDGIRIPDYAYQRLEERRRKTLTRYQNRYGRTPTPGERAAMALFPLQESPWHPRRHLRVVPHQVPRLGAQPRPRPGCTPPGPAYAGDQFRRRQPAPHQAVPRPCLGADDRALRESRPVRNR